jgi:hypothetical protein
MMMRIYIAVWCFGCVCWCCVGFVPSTIQIRGGGGASHVSSIAVTSDNVATTTSSTADYPSIENNGIVSSTPPSWEELKSMLPETAREKPVLTLYR